MPDALVIGRFLVAPPSIAVVAWVMTWRWRRPDQVPRWLSVKLALFPLSIAVAAVASAVGSPAVALAGIGVADLVLWAVALRLWLERRPKSLTPDEAAHEARRLADEAIDLTAVAEREARK